MGLADKLKAAAMSTMDPLAIIPPVEAPIPAIIDPIPVVVDQPPTRQSPTPAEIGQSSNRVSAEQSTVNDMLLDHAGSASAPPMEIEPIDAIGETLAAAVKDKHLEDFYDRTRVQNLMIQLSEREPMIFDLCRQMRLSESKARKLFKLALWDVVMLCDDSGSMAAAEDGRRIEDLKNIISYVARATSVINETGISVRFLNSKKGADNICDPSQVERIVRNIPFQGLTPLGTSLRTKISYPFFFQKLRNQTLTKPLLIIIITDGQPQGEAPSTLHATLKELYDLSGGGRGVAIQIAQVGNDKGAQDFLAQLDSDTRFGSMVDVTSNIEMEQMECIEKGRSMSLEDWICKLLLGAVDSTYDAQDE